MPQTKRVNLRRGHGRVPGWQSQHEQAVAAHLARLADADAAFNAARMDLGAREGTLQAALKTWETLRTMQAALVRQQEETQAAQASALDQGDVEAFLAAVQREGACAVALPRLTALVHEADAAVPAAIAQLRAALATFQDVLADAIADRRRDVHHPTPALTNAREAVPYAEAMLREAASAWGRASRRD